MALFESDFLFDDEDAQEKEASLPESGLSATEALRKRLLEREAESESEAKRLRSELQQLREAKLKLLEAPSRSDMLMGLAQKLAAPRSKDDPRFYERKNLGTFLRDVGEFGQEEKQAEFERQKQINLLKEKYATEDLTAAEASRTRAQQLAAQYLSDEPGAVGKTARTRSIEEEAEMRGVPVSQVAEERRARPAATGARRETAEEVRVRILGDAVNTLKDPNASEADKQKAQLIVDRATPSDIRKTTGTKEKQVVSYLSSLKDQITFTLPDLQSAIDQIDKGGSFAAGNLSKWLEGKPFVGQAATDLERTLESLRSKVGFDKMKELKDLSAVGATGLGAVSNAEQRLLQSVKGSLERDQSPPNLRANLVRIKTFYEEQVPDMLAAAGVSSIDEALKTPQNYLSVSKPKEAAGKKRTIKLPSGRTVEVED